MTATEPTPEELSAVTNIIARFCSSLTTSEDAAHAVLAEGYVLRPEVLRLKEQVAELERARVDLSLQVLKTEDERNAALSILADVETLADRWERDEGRSWMATCADHLREALEGQS